MSDRAFELRPYQNDGVNAAFDAWHEGHQHVLEVLPTGTGKTAMAAGIIERGVREFGKRALFLAHRGVLINQAYNAFTAYGLSADIEKAEMDARKALWEKPDVIVGSVQTLQGNRLQKWDKKQFGLIITDETHRSHCKMHQALYSHFEDYWHLGITATPDGAGNIMNTFTVRAYELTMKQAITDGYLVMPVPYKVPLKIDLREIKCTAGDFNVGDLAERIGPAIEDICRHVQRHIGDRFCCMFCPDVGSAQAAAQALTGLGCDARYVAGPQGKFGMPREESEAILQQFGERRFQGIVCCDLLFEGWDCPHVSAVVVARPTQKRYRYVQSVGRGTRLCPDLGKRDVLVLDFDWQCDDSSRDMCSVIDLFPDEDPKVIEAAREIVRTSSKNPIDALEEAKKRVFRPQQLKIKLTGRDSNVQLQRYDPIGLAASGAGITLKGFDYDIRHNNPITEKQKRYLAFLGLTETKGLSKWGASKLIGQWANRPANMCTLKQYLILKRHGVEAENMQRREASDVIDIITKDGHHGQPQRSEASFA